MSKASRNGYAFEVEVERGLELAPDVDFFKIPDGKSLGRVIPMKVPADFIMSKGGDIYTIEVKQTKLMRIPWRNFKEHQLLWVLQNPQWAVFLINFNDRQSINETFIMTADTLEYLMGEYANSVPIQEFRDRCLQLERKTARFHPEKKGAFIDFSKIYK